MPETVRATTLFRPSGLSLPDATQQTPLQRHRHGFTYSLSTADREYAPQQSAVHESLNYLDPGRELAQDK